MSGSFRYLRRGLFALAILASLGFGATQAVANSDTPRLPCNPTDPGADTYCWLNCSFYGHMEGVCTPFSFCECS